LFIILTGLFSEIQWGSQKLTWGKQEQPTYKDSSLPYRTL